MAIHKIHVGQDGARNVKVNARKNGPKNGPRSVWCSFLFRRSIAGKSLRIANRDAVSAFFELKIGCGTRANHAFLHAIFVRILLALRISEVWGGRAAKIFPPRAAALAFPYLTKKHAKKHAKITVFCTLFGQSKEDTWSGAKPPPRRLFVAKMHKNTVHVKLPLASVPATIGRLRTKFRSSHF